MNLKKLSLIFLIHNLNLSVLEISNYKKKFRKKLKNSMARKSHGKKINIKNGFVF